jgi:hypothetical protein
MMPLEQELQELRYTILDQAEFLQLQMNACFTALKEPDYIVAKELILQVKDSKNSSLDIDKNCEKYWRCINRVHRIYTLF